MYNKGFQNENDIITALNGRKFIDIPNHFKMMISNIFENVHNSNIIYCKKALTYKKTDIYIYVKGERKSISIKSGDNVSIHSEKLDTFCNYLSWLGVSEENIKFLRFYHYGDGSLDGSGNKRMTIWQMIKKYPKEIKRINEEFNEPKMLQKIILRFLKYGTYKQNDKCEYLYYGTVKKGVYCSIFELTKYICEKEYSYVEGIHFGPFLYNTAYRDLSKDNAFNTKRNAVSIKWRSGKELIEEFNNNI